MSQERGPTGPQFHADRPQERDAVRTTIVGGRPPGSGQPLGNIPRGIEVLVKKAAVDPEFRETLLARRADAAKEIDLQLEPAEAMMLATVSRAQLEAVIAQTTVPEEQRRVFLGKVAAGMLAVLGLSSVGCIPRPATKGVRPDRPTTKGIRPDRLPDETEPADGDSSEPHKAVANEPPPRPNGPVSRGIRPDRPPEKPKSGESP
jgi:hypothetical protein